MTCCAVSWCCALPYRKSKHCAVHMAVNEFVPVRVNLQPDYWAEREREWLQLVGAIAPVSADQPPEDPDCPECDGSGECQCCGGSGDLDCHCMKRCGGHQCSTCDGDGQCDACSATGKASGVERNQDGDVVELHEQTRRWMDQRPSQRKAA